MTRYARRVDVNHAAIRDGLRARGWEVLDTSGVGDGIPDMFVKIQPGRSMGLEVKDPKIKKAAQAMTKAQEEYWGYMWQSTRVVQTVQEAHDECLWAQLTWGQT